ncbi:hypothetical protein Taro_012539 [Colocasia esculenta]|uniref:Receptor-like serine/threonine-protein kinase n=1 Tax=Colocasia esculenta TaxID=4460 RepID=A0A843UD19_COLES|nr:hypothetical protein [Colocasia esculenta]
MRRLDQVRWPSLLSILSALLTVSAAVSTMVPGDTVGDGASLASADGKFRLGFFTPGSSTLRYLGIWYNVSRKAVVWVANRELGLNDSTGVLSFHGNGRLTLSDARGVVYWSTGAAAGVANPVARLLDNANFVVTGSGARGDSAGSYAWQSFDYPTDSLLPGMKLGWDLRAGRNRNITSWKSADDPATGEYAMGMDVHGDPQVFLVRGTARLWRAGPWVGQRFSGIPEMNTYDDMFSFSFHDDADEVYYQLVVQPAGVVERVVWVESSGTWNRFWFAPKDQCDGVSPCGPFGVCDSNDSPVCSCLQGFDPQSPQDWYLRDGKDGCARKTALDCRNGTDGFVRVAGAKLPDTSAAVVNYTMGLGECRAACLRNCSCTAYASAQVTGEGTGCILWGGDLTDLRLYTNGGQDLFVRVAAADLGMGRLGDGQEVAVKRLARNSVQGLDEFKNEVVLIAKLQHRNLVRLLGCCIQGDEKMLVYEYMPNKSLDVFLFDTTMASLLDWNTRYQIINGVARGILYLHQDSRLRIIHRDLKASNVLLDKEMNPKISDFGMARIFGGDENEANTRRVVGTYGYMSPEYAMDGIFSVKSDVFSFGVLLLEIVSGKRTRGVFLSDPTINLLGYAWSLWREGTGMELVDSSMTGSYPAAEVLKCIKVGLLCVQERPEDRPTMASVVLMLGGDTASLPQPKQPGFVVTRGPSEGLSPSSRGESCSVNDVTLTMLQAR